MEIFLYALISYLLGSIPTAFIVGKKAKNIDIREHGSGNMGATNTVRTLGWKYGLLVAFIDISKGIWAIGIPILSQADVPLFVIGLFAMIGHAFPIFAQFRGGKCIATGFGVLIMTNPLLASTAFITFVIILLSTKYVAVASITSWIAVCIYSYILYFNEAINSFTIILIMTLFIIIRHKQNIKNLVLQIEPKIR